MGFLDNLLGKSTQHDAWDATHQGLIKEVTYDELVSTLGRPQKAKGGFVFWRGPLTSLDPDYPEGEYFQLSNKDFRGFGDGAKAPSTDRETWFALATSAQAIKILSNEVGGLARSIQDI